MKGKTPEDRVEPETAPLRGLVTCVLVFLLTLPLSFFMGVTVIGHGRFLPYLSVWLDRAVLVAVTLGVPALAALLCHRLSKRRRGRREANGEGSRGPAGR